jgi:putative acetyltransferase
MLREATTSDLEFVHALYTHETISPYIAYDPMPLAEFAPIFDDLLGQVQFLIYQEEARPLGRAQIHWGTHRFVHSAHLGGLAIIPELQSQGVGTRLLHELLGILREKKILRAELCVSADNPRAIAFYEKLGFEHEGTMKKYFSRSGHDSFFDEHKMALFLG